MTYAYSIDGGETYRGSEPTPEDALGAAHDKLATECEPGTTHPVYIARLVPGVEILRKQTGALESLAARGGSMTTKKAYTVSEDGHAVVVFATNGAEARRLGAGELDTTFEGAESCRRSPEFDSYADAGQVPPLVAIQHGWWFECSHCGHKISDGYEGPDGEELQPIADGRDVYCSQAHMMSEWAERRERLARVHASIEACAQRFHGRPIFDLRGYEHYAAGGRDTVSCCDFDFPGRKGLYARWDIGSEHVYISECDLDAWAATGRTTP